MKRIIKTAIDFGIGIALIALKPLDNYSYTIGLLTMLIWLLSDKIYEKYFK